jgi:hypothetical protein
MKVITELIGRVILLVPIEEVYPKEGVHILDAIKFIADKYEFATRTESLDEIREKGARFQIGRFLMEGREEVITDFSVPEGALVVSARNTDIAEAFLHDAIKSLAEHYDFRTEPIVGKTIYVLSEMTVQFEDVFDQAIRNFDALSRDLNETFVQHYGVQEPQRQFKYRVSRLDFDFDKHFAPQPWSSVAPFIMERKTNQPFSQNRYFCRAPFRTREHVRLLEKIEQTFSRKNQLLV